MLNAVAEATQWLFDDLLPFWSAHGLDRAGGFHDQLDDSGRPLDLPKRCRVQSRQIYVFAEAGRMGWNGPWRRCVDHGLDFLTGAFARPDGFVRAKVSRDGGIVDDAADNYDQAFALFAFAHGYARTGDRALVAGARSLLATLRDRRGHPAGGFHEAAAATVPLRSNPHMHLFEAAIAWVEAADLDEFRTLAGEIAALALDRFIDPASGALREYFDGAWHPAAGETGRIVEPGHQFEWAWLLTRWHRLGGENSMDAARRLQCFAETHGVDPARNVAVNEVFVDGSPRDRTARLWPQTERLKGTLAMIELTNGGRNETVVAPWEGLKQYRLPSNPALFRDKLRADGSFVDEPSFASSLYHIVCAISEFDRVARTIGERA